MGLFGHLTTKIAKFITVSVGPFADYFLSVDFFSSVGFFFGPVPGICGSGAEPSRKRLQV